MCFLLGANTGQYKVLWNSLKMMGFWVLKSIQPPPHMHTIFFAIFNQLWSPITMEATINVHVVARGEISLSRKLAYMMDGAEMTMFPQSLVLMTGIMTTSSVTIANCL